MGGDGWGVTIHGMKEVGRGQGRMQIRININYDKFVITELPVVHNPILAQVDGAKFCHIQLH